MARYQGYSFNWIKPRRSACASPLNYYGYACGANLHAPLISSHLSTLATKVYTIIRRNFVFLTRFVGKHIAIM